MKSNKDTEQKIAESCIEMSDLTKFSAIGTIVTGSLLGISVMINKFSLIRLIFTIIVALFLIWIGIILSQASNRSIEVYEKKEGALGRILSSLQALFIFFSIFSMVILIFSIIAVFMVLFELFGG